LKKIGNSAIFLKSKAKRENFLHWVDNFPKSAKFIKEIGHQQEFQQAASTLTNQFYHWKVKKKAFCWKEVVRRVNKTSSCWKDASLTLVLRQFRFKAWSTEVRRLCKNWRTSEITWIHLSNCMKLLKNFIINDYQIH
jgi:hypothetical protein